MSMRCRCVSTMCSRVLSKLPLLCLDHSLEVLFMLPHRRRGEARASQAPSRAPETSLECISRFQPHFRMDVPATNRDLRIPSAIKDISSCIVSSETIPTRLSCGVCVHPNKKGYA